MTTVYLFPNVGTSKSKAVLENIKKASKVSPLAVVTPKQQATDYTPPEPPFAA